MAPQRKFWGWGNEGEGPSPNQQQGIARTIAGRLDLGNLALAPEPSIDQIELREPRILPPASLAKLCDASPLARAGHHYGKSYRDIVRGARGEFPHPPDQVASPQNEDQLVALLAWCDDSGAAAIPYGGGSSVVGGTEAVVGDPARPVVTIDLTRMDRVLEIDRASRAARIQGGALGPVLEDQLRPHGLTLRHYPQSFEFSTLGGWLATRSGGHYATVGTHIDDFVEAMRVVTPSGVLESRRLPGSGAGPSPDRLMLGSEGTLGIITEAWMRLQARPSFRASTTVSFPEAAGKNGFLRGTQALRALGQSGLYPTNARLLDALEAQTSGAGDGTASLLVLGFESAYHAPAERMARALELCRDHGGDVPEGAERVRSDDGAAREGAAGAWRNAFLQAPYVRDVLVRLGLVCETFESAVTWDRFESFHADVTGAVRDAIRRVCGSGDVSVRTTHLYPDGPAPYFSVIAAGKRGSELEQWAEIKAAASDALLAAGGTITHHHAVGRDHRSAYDRQRPDLFARALRAAKRELDPKGTLNPGVLIDPLV